MTGLPSASTTASDPDSIPSSSSEGAAQAVTEEERATRAARARQRRRAMIPTCVHASHQLLIHVISDGYDIAQALAQVAVLQVPVEKIHLGGRRCALSVRRRGASC